MTETVDIVVSANRSLSHERNDELLMSIEGYVAAAVALFFIGFFGFFLNLGVIILMWKDKKLWTPLNIILFNLICSDFSVSILGNPWTLASAVSYKWIFGTVMCEMYGFFMSLLGINSITTLTVLAFERYLIVSRPLRNSVLSKQSARYLVLGIWIYSLTLTVPPLIGWGKFVAEAANISCSVNWEENSYNAMTYIIYLFAFGLLVPLGVIVFSYIHIIRQMKKNHLSTGQTSRAERRVTFMISLMIVAYLVAWSPYAVCSLIVQFGDPKLISPSVGVVPALLAKSSICYNPIIYVGLNSQFRQVMKRLLGFKEPDHCSNCETYAMGVSKLVSNSFNDNTNVKFPRLTPMKVVREQIFVFKSVNCETAFTEEN